MKKLKRNERIGALIKILCDRPNKIFTYNYFSDLFNAAKSSISEDIIIVKRIIEELHFGKIITYAGAAGGVKYIPIVNFEESKLFLEKMCEELQDENRLIPGGFVYYTDIMYTPAKVEKLGKIIATKYIDKNIDYVVTMETKGIPISLMTAKYLNVPLIIVRRDNKVTEGSTVSINYISGSSNKINTMSLSRRSMIKDSRVIIVDDFMKGGGTVKGMVNLMEEFEAKVEGICVFIATKEPETKLVKEYTPLLILDSIDFEKKQINFLPNINL